MRAPSISERGKTDSHPDCRGACPSIGFGGGEFRAELTEGRDVIAPADLSFGNRWPVGALAAALLFGFATALAYGLSAYPVSAGTLFQAVPSVLTLVALAGVIGRFRPPAADRRPYVKQ